MSGAVVAKGSCPSHGALRLAGRQQPAPGPARRGRGGLTAAAQASQAVAVPLPPKGLDRDTRTATAEYICADLVRMTEELGVCAALGAPEGTASLIVKEVERRMPANPYHNFQHIYDVSQFLFTLLTRSGLASQAGERGQAAILDPLEVAALWCSCLCHDLDHPGHTNRLEEALNGPLQAAYTAARRSSQAVPSEFTLEWHHLVAAHQLLCEDMGLTRELEPAEASRFQALLTQVIESTDLARHKQLYDTFRGVVASSGSELGARKAGEVAASGSEPREFQVQLMQWLMKCSDLANTVRPPSCRAFWEDSAFEEFHREGDTLLARGWAEQNDLPAMHDRRQGKREEASEAFFESLALPTFTLLEEYMMNTPQLNAEMATECLALLRARLSMAVQDRKRRGQWRLRAGGATVLGAVLLLAALLLKWSPLAFAGPSLGGASFGEGGAPAPAFALADAMPPLWGVICAGLLGFPLITLWEVQHGYLSQKLVKPAAQETAKSAAPSISAAHAIELGTDLVEFVSGGLDFLQPSSRRKSIGSTEEAYQDVQIGMGRLSRASVRKKKQHRKYSLPEEALRSDVWDIEATIGGSESLRSFRSEAPSYHSQGSLVDGAALDESDGEAAASSEEASCWQRMAAKIRDNFSVLVLCGMMVGMSVVNKVLFRLVLCSVGKYVHALSTSTNCAYLAYSWTIVFAKWLFGTEAQRKQLGGMLTFARENWRLFASTGVCESIAFTLMPIGTPGLPKAVVPVVAQLTLPMSMALNACLFKKKYSIAQAFGIVLIVMGIVIDTAADPTTTTDENHSLRDLVGPFLITTLSYFFLVLSLILKDVAFTVSSNADKKLDIFLLEGLAGIGQGIALLLQWPMNFALLTDLSPSGYLKAAWEGFTSSAGLMPMLISCTGPATFSTGWRR